MASKFGGVPVVAEPAAPAVKASKFGGAPVTAAPAGRSEDVPMIGADGQPIVTQQPAETRGIGESLLGAG